jgi:GT2 family glycosyltransferase
LYEIIVVDNHSSDDTAKRILGEFPDIRLIVNPENFGFAAANNIGIQEAKGEYLLILNPDTLVLPHSIDLLIRFMDSHSDVGICGPQILNSDRTIQSSARMYPTFQAIFYRFTIFKYLGLFRRHFYLWTMRDFDHNSMRNVEQLTGAALMTRFSLVKKLGGFDTHYFIYYEEVDLCKRVSMAGYRVVFYPEPQIIHLGGCSAKQIPAKVKLIMLTSLIFYLRKYYSGWTNRLLIFLFKVGVFTRQIVELLIYGIATLFSLTDSLRREKYYSRFTSCFEFLTKYYIGLLFE